MNSPIREFLKAHPALLAPLVTIYGRRFRRLGCSLHLAADGNLVLAKGETAIRLSITDNAYLPEMAAEFEQFSKALAPKRSNGSSITDYAAPEASGKIGMVATIVAQGVEIGRRWGVQVEVSADKHAIVVRKGDRDIRISIDHRAYLEDVAREFDYFFTSVVPQTVAGRQIVDFSFPHEHEIPGLGLKFKFTSLPEGAITNQVYLDAFKIKPGDVIVDAGAYCGLTAHLFGKAVGPTGRVIAIEADGGNFAAMVENLGRNGPANVTPVRSAIWTEAGEIQFHAEGNMGSAIAELYPGKINKISVPADTLMGICNGLNLDRVDHVKMDIEGSEYKVLPACTDFIARFRPDFVVEAHYEASGLPVNVEKLQSFFTGLGYDMKRLPQFESDWFPLLHFFPTQKL